MTGERSESKGASGDVRLLIIVGPTGTGKSELAVRVAQRLGGEIIGCDALQLYRGFDAGTAKPSAEQRARVPHHLLDVLDPAQPCSAGEWARMADRAIEQVHARAAVPIVVGGSGMYLRGLLRGVVATPPRDARLLARLQAIVERGGSARLHRWLQRLDPETAARLAPADGQRVVRALELALVTDATLSERLRRDGSWAAGADRYPSVKFGLDVERTELNRRLAARVERFYAAGLVSEVRRLLATVPRRSRAFQAIGYREILACIDEGRDPLTARETIERNTRRYAKRQRCWFRKEPDLVRLDGGAGLAALTETVVRRWRDGSVVYSAPSGSGAPAVRSLGEGGNRS